MVQMSMNICSGGSLMYLCVRGKVSEGGSEGGSVSVGGRGGGGVA